MCIRDSGYLGSQDSYYVGYIKGIGKIYQQTFVDTYTRVAFAKVYDEKNSLVAADMLNERYCHSTMKMILICCEF